VKCIINWDLIFLSDDGTSAYIFGYAMKSGSTRFVACA
jgi:hypothetical protein